MTVPVKSKPTPALVRLLVVPLTAAVLVGGLWLTAGLLVSTYNGAIVVAVAWFVVAAVVIRFIVRARPDLRWLLRGTFLLTVVLVGGYTAWTTLRDDVVDEEVVTAAPPPARPAQRPAAPAVPAAPPAARNRLLAAGSFTGIEMDTSGRAQVIRLAGGRSTKLTLTRFATAPGPDYRVFLARGRATLDSVPAHVDLGGLKGNKGDQQYDAPRGVDVRRYDTVVIWCRAFSVGIGQAPLASATS